MDGQRARGRPRSFDEDRVLDALIERFWVQGFSGVSLDELAAAAGVKRASLYLAFGDKETMYLRALERFAADLDRAFEIAFADRPLGEGLEAFYQLSLGQYLSGAVPRGCLVVCTAPVEAVDAPAIKAALARVLRRIDAAFAAAFARAGAADAELRGRLAAAVLHSLAVRARAGEPPDALRSFASQAARTLSAGLGAAPSSEDR